MESAMGCPFIQKQFTFELAKRRHVINSGPPFAVFARAVVGVLIFQVERTFLNLTVFHDEKF